MIFSVGESVEELGTFFHDGEVSGEIGIEYVVNADLLEGAYQFAQGGVLYAQSDLLAPCGPYCRSDLEKNDLFRICQSFLESLSVIALTKSSYRAVCDALSGFAYGRFRRIVRRFPVKFRISGVIMIFVNDP